MKKIFKLIAIISSCVFFSQTFAVSRANIVPSGGAQQQTTTNVTQTNAVQQPVMPAPSPYPPQGPGSSTVNPMDTTQSTQPANPNSAQSDADITTNIQAKMMSDAGLLNSNISAKTTDGMVILDGTANTQAQVDTAIQYAKSVPGVKSVTSNVNVAGQQKNPTPNSGPSSIPPSPIPPTSSPTP